MRAECEQPKGGFSHLDQRIQRSATCHIFMSVVSAALYPWHTNFLAGQTLYLLCEKFPAIAFMLVFCQGIPTFCPLGLSKFGAPQSTKGLGKTKYHHHSKSYFRFLHLRFGWINLPLTGQSNIISYCWIIVCI